MSKEKAETERQRRGELTTRVQNKATELLGRAITVRELRLMPYIVHVSMNQQYVDCRKVNDAEKTILDEWLDNGWLIGNPSSTVRPSKEFWDAMGELMYLAYVDLY